MDDYEEESPADFKSGIMVFSFDRHVYIGANNLCKVVKKHCSNYFNIGAYKCAKSAYQDIHDLEPDASSKSWHALYNKISTMFGYFDAKIYECFNKKWEYRDDSYKADAFIAYFGCITIFVGLFLVLFVCFVCSCKKERYLRKMRGEYVKANPGLGMDGMQAIESDCENEDIGCFNDEHMSDYGSVTDSERVYSDEYSMDMGLTAESKYNGARSSVSEHFARSCVSVPSLPVIEKRDARNTSRKWDESPSSTH
ncbi:hypothetical protein VCUG_00541 [Vavraia culicis subsp. floridensis]|uniref:Uncharacterized protein n=1 Tax=Vavraia culicis (isolate floridensis) TaxID=948595 RepID=L2GXF9_VAVCU|nr:uncharacterized protein VCUG_00541 [Vavraia culicis subsp. floridensis]ELA47958.1 hypothetical protein VCUG_00541 [Vavraia culicis subsp. floridensis]